MGPAQVENQKKIARQKTEEAVSLAQNSGRSDLIPLWCQAPADVRPPPPSPPPRSEAVLFEDLEATEGSEKKKKEKKKKKKNKKERGIETETVAPAIASTSTADTEPPPEQAPLASQPRRSMAFVHDGQDVPIWKNL